MMVDNLNLSTEYRIEKTATHLIVHHLIGVLAIYD